MTTTPTWKPLREAYHHVMKYGGPGLGQRPVLTHWRLLQVLGQRRPGDRQVRCRATYAVFPALPPEQQEERYFPLTGDFWDFGHGESCPMVDWEHSCATLPSHPLGPCDAYKIEVAWEDIIAIWPEQQSTKQAPKRSPLKRGRKRVHDRAEILREAEDDWNEHGAAASLEAWYLRVANRLEDKWPDRPRPERSFMMELLSPKYQSANIR